jgi:transcriptional regulator with XRE-family HTH domain
MAIFRLRFLRTNKGLTQTQLAKLTGLDQSHISKLETGATKPSYDTLTRLAAALGVTVADLLGELCEARGDSEPESAADGKTA